MRLDSFQFFTPDHPPEHLGPILARNRFEGSIAISQNPADPRELLSLVRAHDFVKGAIPWLDLEDPSVTTLLDELSADAKFRGGFHSLGQTVPPAFVELERRRLPVDLRLTPQQLPLASEIAAKFPDLPIAIVHLGSPSVPPDDWARAMAELARFPQVFCKASDLIHLLPAPWNGADLRPYVQHVLKAFSPSRVMFGSGWPSGLPDHIWKETLAAFTQAIGAQPMEVREELLGGAAQAFYGI